MATKKDFDDLRATINLLREEISGYKDAVVQVLAIQEENVLLRSRVKELEVEVTDNQQHQRRHNVIINGIPKSVSDEALEASAIAILESIQVNVTPDKLNAVHKLKNKDGTGLSTIVAFVNRKNAELALLNRKKLAEVNMTNLELPEDTKVFISEDFCPELNKLGWMGRCLFRKRKIKETWMFHGTVYLKKLNGTVIKAKHVDDINEEFPGFKYPKKKD